MAIPPLSHSANQHAREPRAARIAEQRLAGGKGDKGFYEAKIATVRFYADQLLVQAPTLGATVTTGSNGVMALDEDRFLAACARSRDRALRLRRSASPGTP